MAVANEYPVRLVQHKATNLYYQGPGRWTAKPEEAVHFEDILTAARTCWNQRLEQVELVLNFGLTSFDVRLPLGNLGDA